MNSLRQLNELSGSARLDGPDKAAAPGVLSGQGGPSGPGGPNAWTGPGRAAVRGGGKSEAAERLRERAGALFGGGAVAPEVADPVVPEVADPVVRVPGTREFSGGRVGRLRQWLFVRCGLEFRTVLALGVVLVVAAGLAFQHYWVGRPRAVGVPPPVAAALAAPTPAAGSAPPSKAPPKVTVDIAGKVARPGLRRLPGGSRVADALAAAGGPLPGTDTTALNLARQISDGEQILVGVTPPAAPAPADPADPGGSSGAGTGTGPPLSLNSATAAQLESLPGVGPVLAQHILDFRTRHGGFTSPAQLRQIPGIGPRKFATLQPLVRP
ncbi:helix-hairpin-helix domain-containing protein [Streptomyces sp. NBC_01190]|uniref:helix-hairpin-helix domain-containing protein n=1 Tax=Streptomyces sp. NBC_01190 TaxID=2903767 RepID=UPI00386F9BAC|nr:ComEA family DNA-binding protein [Streptomyces sp. NBC_01190]